MAGEHTILQNIHGIQRGDCGLLSVTLIHPTRSNSTPHLDADLAYFSILRAVDEASHGLYLDGYICLHISMYYIYRDGRTTSAITTQDNEKREEEGSHDDLKLLCCSCMQMCSSLAICYVTVSASRLISLSSVSEVTGPGIFGCAIIFVP